MCLFTRLSLSVCLAGDEMLHYFPLSIQEAQCGRKLEDGLPSCPVAAGLSVCTIRSSGVHVPAS